MVETCDESDVKASVINANSQLNTSRAVRRELNYNETLIDGEINPTEAFCQLKLVRTIAEREMVNN